MLLASCATNLDELGDLRPSNVPAEYITTPYGYFHPDCIQILDDNETLQAEGAVARIEQLDGTNSRDLSACVYPHFDSQGDVVADDDLDSTDEEPRPTTPGGSGWFESGDSTDIGAVSYMHAEWNIPKAPASHRKQTVYFFPGLENSKSRKTTILQPVLAWNQGGSDIAGWSLASWNCCKSGKVHHSKYIAGSGSMVSGDISGRSCQGGVCSKWQIVAYDWASGRSTIFNTTSFGLQMNWVFGGVLEAYHISQCSQLPSESVTFSGFFINNTNGAHISTPSWNKNLLRHSPTCGYKITLNGANLTLHY